MNSFHADFGIICDVASLGGVAQLDMRVLRQHLLDKGLLLLRGLPVEVHTFEALCRELLDAPMIHGGRRQQTSGSDFVQYVDPGEHAIIPHCEYAYTPMRPDVACFFCEAPASSGGQTVVVDGVRAFSRLQPSTQEAFATRRVAYENVIPPVGWQRMFGTSSVEQLATYLREVERLAPSGGDSFQFELDPAGQLWYRLVTSSLVHGRRGGTAYADSACGFPDRTVGWPAGRRGKLTYSAFEDGSPISEELRSDVRHIVGSECALSIDWRPGDMAIIDNWSVLHGRRAFSGVERKIHACFGYAAWIRPPTRSPLITFPEASPVTSAGPGGPRPS